MLNLKMNVKGMAAAKVKLGAMPAVIIRARTSALKSVGNYGRYEMRKFVTEGGSGWKSLHPLTQRYSKSRSGKWIKKSKISPLFFLGRFARYFVTPDGSEVRIGFGKSKVGQGGKFDKLLQMWLTKHEKSMTTVITPEMRVKLRAGFLKAGLKVLKRSSQFITIPPRPIIGPVRSKLETAAPKLFEQRFNAAIDRYMTGNDTRTTAIELAGE